MPVPAVADTRPSDWKYVSEGGATVVFSYIGPSNSRFSGTVLRLRKVSQTIGVTDKADDPIIEFQEKCTSRLMSPIHLPRLEPVSLEKEWIRSLTTLHDDSRPVERRSKDCIDTSRTKGVLATDLVGGDWIAVEIKPKWAFLPSAEHLSPETRPAKTKTCRYCMYSRVRAKEGEKQAVGYCPLDLFSGEGKRINCAISNLWDAWVTSDGGINNLKIFVRGKLIKPSEASSMSAADVLQSIDIKESFTSALLPLLMGTTVLKRISYLQRTLDPLDIEGLSKLWRDAGFGTKSTGATARSLFSEPTMDEWDEFVSRFLSSETNRLEHSNPDPSRLRYLLFAYLLSATFKDCSLIVRLDFLGTGGGVVKAQRVSVIDLDRKSMTRMERWEKLDSEIAERFLKSGWDKTCVE
ncbi:hypothetical protein AX15_006278 [Amanita polypyramis BW_CC]|nr:hypothetical protein AX15_006278 [Amanita polypyramis BW_CC]